MLYEEDVREAGWFLYDNDVNKNSPQYSPVYKYVESETWYMQLPTFEFKEYIIRKMLNGKPAPVFVGWIPSKEDLLRIMSYLAIKAFKI